MQARTRPVRGFTLIELMVASAIAFIIVAAAAALASAMARNVKRVEEQSDLAVRAAIAHAFLTDVLSGAGYNWNVSKFTSGTANTGAFGPGACAVSSTLCAAGDTVVYPMQLCSSASTAPNLTATGCTAPDNTHSDVLVTYVPRDSLLEATKIQDPQSGTGSVPSVALWSTRTCTAPGTHFIVKGAHADWATGDILLVAKRNHVSIARLAGDLAASDGAAAQVINVTLPTDLATDDGLRTTACAIDGSLDNAVVSRIRGMTLKVATGVLKTTIIENTVTGTKESVLLSNVDDLGFRWQIASISATAASLCTTDTGSPWDDTDLGGTCPSVELAGGSAGTHYRVTGLHVGLVVSSSVSTQSRSAATAGVFDRTGTVVTDFKLHRTVTLFQGLSNASAF